MFMSASLSKFRNAARAFATRIAPVARALGSAVLVSTLAFGLAGCASIGGGPREGTNPPLSHDFTGNLNGGMANGYGRMPMGQRGGYPQGGYPQGGGMGGRQMSNSEAKYRQMQQEQRSGDFSVQGGTTYWQSQNTGRAYALTPREDGSYISDEGDIFRCGKTAFRGLITTWPCTYVGNAYGNYNEYDPNAMRPGTQMQFQSMPGEIAPGSSNGGGLFPYIQ